MLCLVFRDRSGQQEILSELASQERLFYHQLALIWQAVLVPLLRSGLSSYTKILMETTPVRERGGGVHV